MINRCFTVIPSFNLIQAMFQLGTTFVTLPMGGLYPAVGMHSIGEEVRLFLGLNWLPEEDSFMSVDSNEEEWYRLSDIRLNGQVCFGPVKGWSF
jgi:hypothetical protein